MRRVLDALVSAELRAAKHLSRAFAEDYRESCAKTLRLLATFSDEDLSFVPTDGAMSLQQQIVHLRQSMDFLGLMLTQDDVGTEKFKQHYDVNSIAGGIDLLAEAARDVCAKAESLSLESWQQPLRCLGEDYQNTRLALAHVLLEHENHHRAILHLYARGCGRVVPVLYRAAEPVWLDQIR